MERKKNILFRTKVKNIFKKILRGKGFGEDSKMCKIIVSSEITHIENQNHNKTVKFEFLHFLIDINLINQQLFKFHMTLTVVTFQRSEIRYFGHDVQKGHDVLFKRQMTRTDQS